MKHIIFMLAVAAVASVDTACQSNEELTSSTHLTSAWARVDFPVPPGASLTGSARVNEIGAFPEEIMHAQGHPDVVDTAAGTPATDSLYESAWSYDDTIAFYDHALSSNGYKSSHRTAMSTVTIWSVRCPDGGAARVAVRKTSPTGVEVVSADTMEPVGAERR